MASYCHAGVSSRCYGAVASIVSLPRRCGYPLPRLLCESLPRRRGMRACLLCHGGVATDCNAGVASQCHGAVASKQTFCATAAWLHTATTAWRVPATAPWQANLPSHGGVATHCHCTVASRYLPRRRGKLLPALCHGVVATHCHAGVASHCLPRRRGIKHLLPRRR